MKIITAAVAVAMLGSASLAKAADVPGIPGLHIGMPAKDAIASFDFEEEKAPDPNEHHIIAPAYFPGYWHGKKLYSVGSFQFEVTLHIDPSAQTVDFISLVENFKDPAAKVPDLKQVPAALTEKYGAPLHVLLSSVPGQEPRYTDYWWNSGVMVECLTHSGGSPTGAITPSVMVYYNKSDFTKNAQNPKSALGQGL